MTRMNDALLDAASAVVLALLAVPAAAGEATVPEPGGMVPIAGAIVALATFRALSRRRSHERLRPRP